MKSYKYFTAKVIRVVNRRVVGKDRYVQRILIETDTDMSWMKQLDGFQEPVNFSMNVGSLPIDMKARLDNARERNGCEYPRRENPRFSR